MGILPTDPHPITPVSDPNCLFCRISAGDLPADIVHQDERSVAFRDIAPQAPVHVLVIPRRHIQSLAHAGDGDRDLLGHLMMVARDVARAEGLADGGYRTVVNIGRDGGQSVDHLHVHVLGGRAMSWPPG